MEWMSLKLLRVGVVNKLKKMNKQLYTKVPKLFLQNFGCVIYVKVTLFISCRSIRVRIIIPIKGLDYLQHILALTTCIYVLCIKFLFKYLVMPSRVPTGILRGSKWIIFRHKQTSSSTHRYCVRTVYRLKSVKILYH